MALLPMALLTMAPLTMALLTMALLTVVVVTMDLLTTGVLTMTLLAIAADGPSCSPCRRMHRGPPASRPHPSPPYARIHSPIHLSDIDLPANRRLHPSVISLPAGGGMRRAAHPALRPASLTA